jgi:hypothetical protein
VRVLVGHLGLTDTTQAVQREQHHRGAAALDAVSQAEQVVLATGKSFVYAPAR